MKDDERNVLGNKVTAKVTNVRNLQWCKSNYGSDYKTKQIVGIVEKVVYIRKSDIGPVQCYITTSFDFGCNDVMSNKMHLSQLKIFVKNEQPIDPPNTSIATLAGAVVELNTDASYETQPFDNGNNNII
jgi:hypothetical protein